MKKCIIRRAQSCPSTWGILVLRLGPAAKVSFPRPTVRDHYPSLLSGNPYPGLLLGSCWNLWCRWHGCILQSFCAQECKWMCATSGVEVGLEESSSIICRTQSSLWVCWQDVHSLSFVEARVVYGVVNRMHVVYEEVVDEMYIVYHL